MDLATQIDTEFADFGTARRQATAFGPLVVETFKAFRPYLNVFDPGIKTLDSRCPLTGDLLFKPVHMIPKIVWQLNREYKCQKAAGVQSPRVVYPTGEMFRPFADMVAKIFSENHCDRAIRSEDTYYYTSGRDFLGMAYLDIDAHFEFQTDKDRASRLVRAAFPFAFHAASNRGTNEFLKVAHAGQIHHFNDLCGRLQAAMRKVFNRLKILCDFEVKGTITTNEKSGSLAKLPWKRGWNFGSLDEFLACETINLYRLEKIIVGLEQNADDPEWADHREALKKAETESLRQAADDAAERRTKAKARAAEVAPIVTSTLLPPVATPPTPASPPTHSLPAPTTPSRPADYATANANPDRLQANIALARLYAQEIKRVPTLDEFLDFLKTNAFYTGSWEQTLSARRDRCKYVLRVYVAKHWDASKVNGPKAHGSKRIPVNVTKWSNYCKQFPEEWVETLNCKGVMKAFHLTRDDAQAYFAINWTLLVEHPNADGSVPFDAILAFWQDLYATGKTSARPTDDKIAALRAVFDTRGIITITDPNYSPHLRKAIRYKLGPNAPGQSDYWKKKGQESRPATTGEVTTLPSTQHIHITISRQDNGSVRILTIPPCRAGP